MQKLIKRTENDVESTLDIRSLIQLKNTVRVLTQILLSDRQVAMLKNQRRHIVMDSEGGSDSENHPKSTTSCQVDQTYMEEKIKAQAALKSLSTIAAGFSNSACSARTLSVKNK